MNVRFLVASMNGLNTTVNMPAGWVGLVLLPIAGNVADHLTTASHSARDDLDLSIIRAFGAAIQMSLFVIPFLVMLGWGLHTPLNLLFDPFESIILFVTGMLHLRMFLPVACSPGIHVALMAAFVFDKEMATWMDGVILIGKFSDSSEAHVLDSQFA